MVGIVVFAVTAHRELLDKLPVENDLLKRVLIAAQPTVILLLVTAGGTAAASTAGLRSLLADWASDVPIAGDWIGPIATFMLVGMVLGTGTYLGDRWSKTLWAEPDDTDLITDWRAASVIPNAVYGGVTEEILMRWGIMTLILAGLASLSGTQGDPSGIVVLITIVASAVVFAAGHLPAAMISKRRTRRLVLRILGLNLPAGLLFGWLFWRWNLATAMAAHVGFHFGAAMLVVLIRQSRSAST